MEVLKSQLPMKHIYELMIALTFEIFIFYITYTSHITYFGTGVAMRGGGVVALETEVTAIRLIKSWDLDEEWW